MAKREWVGYTRLAVTHVPTNVGQPAVTHVPTNIGEPAVNHVNSYKHGSQPAGLSHHIMHLNIVKYNITMH